MGGGSGVDLGLLVGMAGGVIGAAATLLAKRDRKPVGAAHSRAHKSLNFVSHRACVACVCAWGPRDVHAWE